MEDLSNNFNGDYKAYVKSLSIGKDIWQGYLFPIVKLYCSSCDIEDTNTAIEAVRLWLNVHATN